VDDAVATRNSAQSKVRRTRNPNDFRRYTQLRESCDATISRAQEDYWRNFCSSIDKNTTARELWGKINLKSKRG
jgi:hypothetical protein